MDKNFNDQELSDIMKEIEALEEDFKAEVDGAPSDVLEELSEMKEEIAIPHSKSKAANVVPMKKDGPECSDPVTGATTAMNFKVNGEFSVELQFDIGGSLVMLEVTEQGLQIAMEGGITFSVPVPNNVPKKKAV